LSCKTFIFKLKRANEAIYGTRAFTLLVITASCLYSSFEAVSVSLCPLLVPATIADTT